MSTKRMLIDAAHPEETRVVVLSGKRLEDLDVEVASKKQLKGNIYLAKVTRVEPSLQAAFVDYGGNRHGFLAFNEIHPDYYQIPIADREALVAEYEAEQTDDDSSEENGESEGGSVETVGGDDSEEIEARRPRPSPRRYKIQEVIKRRQILLIQVVKEERGNKGAALTTYMSLAGRYCVLMPNTSRGGGISRKISNLSDRKRLKSIISSLKAPEGIAVIVRTAGAQYGKAEIKRDYEYLLRLWSNIREVTLESTAPCLVHEEANLIKRSIRDLYSKDIEEIIVDGDEGYRTAKDFMKLLIPSHARRVQPYRETHMPLFQRYQVESQLDAMHSPTVQLKSGGYIVINTTEALVAIDVNSGRSTRERNIEETALKTNLEAADEVARELRLRDLAGLIVIDFIDMEVNRNQTQVERRLKEAMKNDRARIQLGRISPFGLLELSRQRLRPSLFETTFEPCQYCDGTGARRSTESTALYVLRAIEEEGMRRRSAHLVVHVPTEIALYILNNKRRTLAAMETDYEFTISLTGDDSLIPPDHRIERVKSQSTEESREAAAKAGKARADKEKAGEERAGEERQEQAAADGEEETGKRRRRRRPRRRKRSDEEASASEAVEAAGREQAAQTSNEPSGKPSGEAKAADGGGEEDETPTKRRRRGRRGGRRRGRKSVEQTDGETTAAGSDQGEAAMAEPVEDTAASEAATAKPIKDTATVEAKDEAAPESPKDAKAQVKAKAKTKVKAKVKAKSKGKMKAKAKTKAKTKAKPKAKTAKKTKPETTGIIDLSAPEPITGQDSGKIMVGAAGVGSPARPTAARKEEPSQSPVESTEPGAASGRDTGGADTPVIAVGASGDAKPAEGNPKKGWWNRA